jgi:mRNA interferase MazF
MTYEPFDVVVVPFPFSDSPKVKVRKALVLTPKSMNEKNGATTLMMITSRKNSEWMGDIALENWADAGLKKPCFVRFKFFTAGNELIQGKVGSLSVTDKDAVKEAMGMFLPKG